MQEMEEAWVQSPDREDPLEESMASHSNILAWRIPRTEEPGGPQSRGWQSQKQLGTLAPCYFKPKAIWQTHPSLTSSLHSELSQHSVVQNSNERGMFRSFHGSWTQKWLSWVVLVWGLSGGCRDDVDWEVWQHRWIHLRNGSRLTLTGRPQAWCLASAGPQVPATWAFPRAATAPRGSQPLSEWGAKLEQTYWKPFFLSNDHASEVTWHQLCPLPFIKREPPSPAQI